MAKDHDEISTPKSQALREDATIQQSQVTTTANAGAMMGTGALKSIDKAKEAVARKELQGKLDQRALSFMQTNPPKRSEDEFVTIRAMKSHHPAPRVGTFSFQDVYNCFVEGMKYKCPKAVALHLEETENATILG